MMGMLESPFVFAIQATIYCPLLEYVLLLCGDCSMVISTMLDVVIMIMIIMTEEEDNERPMQYVPKRKRPLRHIGINSISKGIKLLCQYIEHHINNMKIS